MKCVQSCANRLLNVFRLGTLASVFVLAFLCSIMVTTVYANDHHQSNQKLATELETKFWTLVEHNDSSISSIIAEIFQGVSPEGIINRNDLLALVASTPPFNSFSFENLKATRHNSFLVVSYQLIINQTSGSQLSTHLHVWKKIEDHWQLVGGSGSGEPD